MNKLKPGSIPKIATQGGQFKMMENINKFQDAIKRYGVPDIDVFQTVDLYERRNIPQVTQCIMALGRTVSLLNKTIILYSNHKNSIAIPVCQFLAKIFLSISIRSLDIRYYGK